MMDQSDKRRILVVDDDSGTRILLLALLRDSGFNILEACNGKDALERMRGGGTDLVILDLMMPDVSGWDVLTERDSDPSLQKIPVIITTAGNRSEVMLRAVGKRVSAVIAKPFDLAVVLEAVRRGLETSSVLERTAA